MTMKDWEKHVLAESGAVERVDEIEEELRVAIRHSDIDSKSDTPDVTLDE